MTQRQQGPPPPASGRQVKAWCLYAFANSSFSTLTVTFVYSTYFATDFIEEGGTILWSWAIAASAVLIALLSPIAGAFADRGGHRLRFLATATAMAIGASVLLYFAAPGQVAMALTCFVVANVAYEMGIVFYNAYLPDLAPPDQIGRISGYGWSLGYVGGLLAMALAWVGFIAPGDPWFGFTTEQGENVRATNLLVAAWFALFSLPLFIWMRDRHPAVRRDCDLMSGFADLAATLREIGRYREAAKFLAARLVYNDGLITVFSFGGIYAAAEFGFSLGEVMLFGIVLNVTAGLGALGLGFLDDRIGGKRTILLSIVGLIAGSLVAVVTSDRTLFWAGGILIGICVGPNQSASRSLMGRFAPADKKSEFYGLFAFSGKATALLAPLLFGLMQELFDSHRMGMSVVLVFFVCGGILLLKVDERAGRLAGAGEPASVTGEPAGT